MASEASFKVLEMGPTPFERSKMHWCEKIFKIVIKTSQILFQFSQLLHCIIFFYFFFEDLRTGVQSMLILQRKY